MKRAIDLARAELARATTRDAILACFFQHARTLFKFSALFIVRGDDIVGRYADGIDAPPELVASITYSLHQRGILSRAVKLARPFAVSGVTSEADSMLFGSLGRVVTAGVAVPVVVRDRVVAVFLGDGTTIPAERALESGRSPVDVAKDEMLVWSNAVGEALEANILSRKKSASVPPPRMPGETELIPKAPPSPAIAFLDEPAPVPIPTVEGLPADEGEAAPSRLLVYATASAVALALAVGGGWAFLRASSAGASNPFRALPGFPIVDPAAAAALARGPGPLVRIVADTDARGHADVANESLAITLSNGTTDAETVVRADSADVREAPARRCGPDSCSKPVPPPHCSFAQVMAAAKTAGLGDDEHARVTYADGAFLCEPPGPRWLVSAPRRGELLVDAGTCAVAAGETFVPAAVALEGLRGAKRELAALDLLEDARRQAGLGAQAALVEIDVRGVGDGAVVDPSRPEQGAEFSFGDPVGTPGRRARRVRLGACGLERAKIDRELRPSVPLPHCRLADVRAYAHPKAADERVRIRYRASPKGVGVWLVDLATGVVEVSDAECEAWALLHEK